MAVQAQYPSNVLLLNNRNLVSEGNNNHQLGNDYSLQPQPGGGGFLHQPHLLFNNFGAGISTYPRKRGREVNSNATTTTTANKLPINHMQQQLQQQQPPQLIDLTQLHSHPSENVVSTGLRLSFNDQQQQQQQQQLRHHHHQHQQNHQNSLSRQSSVVLSLLSEDLSSQIKHQRDEIEHFIQSQAEELKRTLAEKRHRHYRALIASAEESVARRLREKEAEVEKASRRNAELEARAAQLSAEAQVWQARARAQEVTAATLQAQLQQAIVSGGCAGNNNERGGGGGEDAETGGGAAEDAESAYIDPDRVVVASGPGCKACGKRVASVVLLPCRHLCVCTGCDNVVQACPLCLSFRSSSVEVFLS